MAGNTLTRSDLSEAVYREIGLSRNESAEMVETVLARISSALVKGENVKISSFGTFAVRFYLFSEDPPRSFFECQRLTLVLIPLGYRITTGPSNLAPGQSNLARLG